MIFQLQTCFWHMFGAENNSPSMSRDVKDGLPQNDTILLLKLEQSDSDHIELLVLRKPSGEQT